MYRNITNSKISYPSISLIIPVYNEETNLKRLLPSLTKQKYPKNKIEYIIVDDNSSDNSLRLAKDFGAKIIKVKTHDIERNKGIGLHVAKNDLIYWLDADMELCTDNYLKLMAKPFQENENLIGAFTNEFALDCPPTVKNSFLRFISYDPFQCDPTYKFFSPSLKNTFIKDKKDYYLCQFTSGKIPPCGRSMYRRKELLKTDVGKNRSFIDMDALEIVTQSGHNLFAYVPKAKMRHYHCDSLIHLIRKKPFRNTGTSSLADQSYLRDQSGAYLPNFAKRRYLWFDHGKPKAALKIMFWVIYANLFIPELIRGIWKAIKHKDPAFLWQPLAAITITDAMLYGFLTRSEGRKLTLTVFKSLFHPILKIARLF